MKSYEEIVKACNAKIPRDAISQREGSNGRKLSYLEGHYVISLLNEVFGQGSWAYSSSVELLHTGAYPDKYGKDVHHAHYSAQVRLVVQVGDKPTEFTDYGYGDGTDKQNPGKAHELAIKEAVTDGLKRAARCLGNAFGNGLYDKSGEGISDEKSNSVSTLASGTITNTSTGARTSSGNDAGRKGSVSGGTETRTSVSSTVQPRPSRETINKAISAHSQVVLGKKIKSQAELLAMVESLGAKRKEDLTDEGADKLLNQLKELVK